MGYFESISNVYGWLEKSPTKTAVLDNAKKPGRVTMLENSNNRAVVIDTEKETFLQSYDTIILKVDKGARTIEKVWNGYTKTTFKHITDFLRRYGVTITNKKEWQNSRIFQY